MTILSQKDRDAQTLCNAIDNFFSRFQIGKLLRKCNAHKEKGVPVTKIFRYIVGNVFNARSMYMQIQTDSYKEEFSKNAYYRFLNNAKINWLRFTTLLSSAIVERFMRGLTSEERRDVFIIDDTLYAKAGYKKTDMVAKVFDHTEMKFRKGFRLLTLGWSDGNSFVPINFSLLSSHNESNQLGIMDIGDRRTLGAKRREMAVRKAPQVMLELLRFAIDNGHRAKYVLFDTWFSNPAQIVQIKDIGLDTIAMVKKSSRIKYGFDGQRLSSKQIFKTCRKRRGRSRYLLSVDIMVGKGESAVPAKLVYVRNRSNRKDWICLLSTDTSLSEDEIIRIYGKRWDIEVFFKNCKTYLRLQKECQSLSYDAMTAHVASVMTRYMILSVYQRQDEDHRALGELFFLILKELEDITFHESMMIILEAMLQTLTVLFRITEEQMEELTNEFFDRLPLYMQNLLSRAQARA